MKIRSETATHFWKMSLRLSLVRNARTSAPHCLSYIWFAKPFFNVARSFLNGFWWNALRINAYDTENNVVMLIKQSETKFMSLKTEIRAENRSRPKWNAAAATDFSCRLSLSVAMWIAKAVFNWSYDKIIQSEFSRRNPHRNPRAVWMKL